MKHDSWKKKSCLTLLYSIDSTICDVHFAPSGSTIITLLHSGIEMIQAKKRMHRGSFALEVSIMIIQRTPGWLRWGTMLQKGRRVLIAIRSIVAQKPENESMNGCMLSNLAPHVRTGAINTFVLGSSVYLLKNAFTIKEPNLQSHLVLKWEEESNRCIGSIKCCFTIVSRHYIKMSRILDLGSWTFIYIRN